MTAFASPLLGSGANEILLATLQLAHMLVLGCWLGAELVINRLYRYPILATAILFTERDRMLIQVMKINQLVRYALVMQFATGLCLASLLGYLPFALGWVLVFSFAWVLLVYLGHNSFASSTNRILKMIERDLRLIVIGVLIMVSGLGVIGEAYLPFWLALKVFLFSGIIVCGLGIRFVMARLFKVWNRMREHGPTPLDESDLRKSYLKVTAILILLWVLVATITVLSLFKPV